MGADLTVYCLQQVTDYAEFERLCHDLMSLVGYSSIEPLGGFKDKGRDAVHVSISNETTIFAYSVREDWRAKLAEDADKIHKHGHTCNKLAFVTTAEITPGERDEAIGSINEQYKWNLELYGLERLRNLLDAQFPHIKANHPQIFPPEFLAIQTQMKRVEKRDYILISYATEDIALAEWLARKLTAEGYLVWCERFRRLGGEYYPDDVDDAIQERVSRVLALYSQASLSNPDIIRQRAIAIGISRQIPNFLIALRVEQIPVERMDQATRQLIFVPFETNWAEGLRLLLGKLEAVGCPKLLPNGKGIAAGAFLEKDVLSDDVETVVTNYLRIHRLPDVILRFNPKQVIQGEKLDEMKLEWAFREVSDRLFLSFHQPPQSLATTYELRPVGRGSWRGAEKVEGIITRNLVSELIRKALIVKCLQKGLQYCQQTGLYYFPFGLVPGDKIKYRWPNGKTASINTVGERKYSRGGGDEHYHYYLAPNFYVSQHLLDDFAVLVRVRVRITDTLGVPLPTRKANSRRKDLCKDWWNGEWLSRMLSICQYLANGENIVIGEQESEQIIIGAEPLNLTAPRGVDEAALDQSSYEREDVLFPREDDEEDMVEAEVEP
jgi:hypothetical protein